MFGGVQEAEENPVSQGPATPRAGAGEEVKSPYGRADSSCEDEPAPKQAPAALPSAGLATDKAADAAAHAHHERELPSVLQPQRMQHERSKCLLVENGRNVHA